jgi:hypothetical protein
MFDAEKRKKYHFLIIIQEKKNKNLTNEMKFSGFDYGIVILLRIQLKKIKPIMCDSYI